MDIITVIGLAAAFCTTFSFLPQAIQTIKTKHTKDLSLPMYSVLTLGIFLWFIYGVFTNDLPVYLANGISLLFTSTILFLIIKYR